MAYTPLNPSIRINNVQSESLENVELQERSAQSHQYAPPASSLPITHSNSTYGDTKTIYESYQPPVRHWPLESQQVARLTPLRFFIIVFDTILASTPIMFIGWRHRIAFAHVQG